MRAYDNGGTENDPSDDVFYVQVGNPYQWHNTYWGAPETAPENDPNLSRVALAASASKPAGDIAGETAAALASASMVLRADGQVALADQLLEEAKQLFNFAEAYPEEFRDPLSDEFYRSYDAQDELAWGAAWLYKATGDPAYLHKAEAYAQHLVYDGGNQPTDKKFGWASKDFGVAALLAEATGDQQYFDRLSDHHAILQNISYMADATSTNSGLAQLDWWGATRFAANAALIELQYARLLAERGNPGDAALIGELINFGSDQIDYILGDNQSNQSYLIGFGSKYPQQPHHQASSGFGWDRYDDDVPNTYTLYGAMVGGPSTWDQASGGHSNVWSWADDRTDYIRAEVSTDYNAGLSSVLAALAELAGNGDPTGSVTGDIGGAYGNYFGGTAQDEVVNFHGGSGNYADGGTGADQLAFGYNASDYTLLGEGDHFTIRKVNSTDSIQFTNFEQLSFADVPAVSVADLVANSGYQAGSHWATAQNVSDLLGSSAFIGGTYGNYFNGSADNNILFFMGGEGNYADGAGGDDRVVFQGDASGYTILGEGDHFTVREVGSTDSIQFTNFEAVSFDGSGVVRISDLVAAAGQQPGSHWVGPQNIADLLPTQSSIGGMNGDYFGGSGRVEMLNFTGGTNNYADGGAGVDWIVFEGNASDYTILGEGDHFTIRRAGTSESIQFTKFEYLTFADAMSVSLDDIIANAGQQPGDYWFEAEPIGGLI